MALKKRVENAQPYMVQMSRTDTGYDITIHDTKIRLSTDSVIHEIAVRICGDYDSPDSLARQILNRSTLTLELVNQDGVYENRIGVILLTDANDAIRLRENPEIYNDIMSAIGEACPSIEHDRIEVVSNK